MASINNRIARNKAQTKSHCAFAVKSNADCGAAIAKGEIRYEPTMKPKNNKPNKPIVNHKYT